MIFHIIIVFLICAISESFQSSLPQQLGSKCQLDKNRFGVCQLKSECKSTHDAFKEPIICSNHEFKTIVCCETESITTHVRHKNAADSNLPKYLKYCYKFEEIYDDLWGATSIPTFKPETDFVFDYTSTDDPTPIFNGEYVIQPKYATKNDKWDDATPGEASPSVFGGSKAVTGQFYHMALVGYGELSKINWNCGGVLINRYFVLTAAHCLNSREFGKARYVRLGALDIDSITDDMKPQDFIILEAIKHPDYAPPLQYNDIALLKLDKKVKFAKNILPACLYDKRRIPAYSLQAVGWGNTKHTGERSNHLLYVNLLHVQHSECNNSYDSTFSGRKLTYGIKDEIQICAGGTGKGENTCEGDSGGPLHLISFNELYKVVGITSLGTICGSNVPGVYTRVSAFIPWIESIVWP